MRPTAGLPVYEDLAEGALFALDSPEYKLYMAKATALISMSTAY
jgi:hypothetical protein